MTSLEIKFLVYKKWGSITAAARELHCSRSQLSYCISRKRISQAIRERLAAAPGMTVEQLFAESKAREDGDGRGLEDKDAEENEQS